ncbi:DJ-1/PfpI family protein [Colletotrichum tofieldiae]|nr:DJ-1/PfpI family protein [Colletotrichum tofieldiae]GKT70813.1 DJ-1/PfpI family protein [Colletotrichum tofieldiae]
MSTTVATEVNCTLDITPPKNWAVALFDSFDSIDVFGRLNPLFYLAFSRQLNLALLAETLDPVWVRPVQESLNTQNSSFWFSVNPTHTYDNPPEGVEVLLVPGGPGATVGDAKRVVEYVRGTYPSLKYLITTCTGAGIAARAGVLDGKRATTNKAAWSTIVKMGPNVNWVSPARWVVDGNIWTASGSGTGFLPQESALKHKRIKLSCDCFPLALRPNLFTYLEISQRFTQLYSAVEAL